MKHMIFQTKRVLVILFFIILEKQLLRQTSTISKQLLKGYKITVVRYVSAHNLIQYFKTLHVEAVPLQFDRTFSMFTVLHWLYVCPLNL